MKKQRENVRFREIREELGYTQEQFAEILDMSLSGYKKLEGGQINVTIDKIYILNRKLGLSADYILFEEKPHYKDIWIEICKLIDIEKWKILFRLYTYFNKKGKMDYEMGEMLEAVDETVANLLDETRSDE